jgi:hypothetical protein
MKGRRVQLWLVMAVTLAVLAGTSGSICGSGANKDIPFKAICQAEKCVNDTWSPYVTTVEFDCTAYDVATGQDVSGTRWTGAAQTGDDGYCRYAFKMPLAREPGYLGDFTQGVRVVASVEFQFETFAETVRTVPTSPYVPGDTIELWPMHVRARE